jgi:hypothetical protein
MKRHFLGGDDQRSIPQSQRSPADPRRSLNEC